MLPALNLDPTVKVPTMRIVCKIGHIVRRQRLASHYVKLLAVEPLEAQNPFWIEFCKNSGLNFAG